MGMPFPNPVIGGNGSLVVPQIQSPNFVHGSSGWQAKQDGSAEFNDLTARGTITGSQIVIDDASGSILIYSGPTPITFGSPVNPDHVLTDASWGTLRTTFGGYNVLDLGAGGSYQSGNTWTPSGTYPNGLSANTGYKLTVTAWLPASYTASSIQIEWLDSTGNSVGSDPVGQFPAVSTAGWYTIEIGGTSPPTCTGAYLVFEILCGASDHPYVRQLDLCQGSAALLASIAAVAGTDPYGYGYPAGVAFNEGFTYGSLLSYRTVGSNQLAIGSVINEKIASGAVATGNIQNAAITNALLAAAAVAASNIQNGAITTTQINAAAGILGTQLAANTVGLSNLASAVTARALGGIETTVSGTAPSSPTAGDIWIDSANGYQLNQYTGSAWSAITFTGSDVLASGSVNQAQLNSAITARSLGGITTTIASTAPSSPIAGDIWIDSANGYQLQQYSGSAWTAVSWTATDVITSGSITTTLLASSVTARALGGITTTIASSAPSSPTAGDIWINSGNGYQINQYSGSAWVAVTWTATDVISAGTISGALITAATITGSLIAAGTITASNIAASTITASQIAAATITTSQIAASTITGSNIASGTITASNIQSGTITATQIASATITGSLIAAGTITASNIAAGTITGSLIAASTIEGSNIDAATITASNIAAGTLTGDLIAANAIVAGLIAAGAVDGMTLNAITINGDTITAADILISAAAGNGLFAYSAGGGQQVITLTSGTSWKAPAGVTSVKVECVGGGGGGGAGNYGPGGGGGEYAAEASVAVTAGNTYTYAIGAAGTAGSGAGGAGGNTTFTGDSVTVTAHGGSGGGTASGGTPGAGGTGSTNTTHHNGGSGGAGSSSGYGGGGGGGSGGASSAGNAGKAATSSAGGAGGTAVSGGGPGGTGGFGTGSPTSPATGPGGGGGGGSSSGGINGAAGYKGQIKLTYTPSGGTTLAASIAGASGTDPVAGTSYPAGITSFGGSYYSQLNAGTAVLGKISSGLSNDPYLSGMNTGDLLIASGSTGSNGSQIIVGETSGVTIETEAGSAANPLLTVNGNISLASGSIISGQDTWHSLTPGNGWTGTFNYKLMPNNCVHISMNLTAPSASVNGVTIVTLPSGYRPSGSHFFAAGASVVNTGNAPQFNITSAGVVQSNGVGASAVRVCAEVDIPLDN